MEEIRKREDFDDRKLCWLEGGVHASGPIDGYDCASGAGCVDLGATLKTSASALIGGFTARGKEKLIAVDPV